MNRFGLILFINIVFFSCNNFKDNKIRNNEGETFSRSKFESKLIDYRLTIGSFNSNYKFIKFGVLQKKDDLFGFVIKLHPETERKTVDSYTIGCRAYESTLELPISFDVNPKIVNKDGDNYIIIERELSKSVRYFDSIHMFIYDRNNWKSSGTLGEYTFKDILFE